MAEHEALGESVRALRPKAGLPSLRAFTDSSLHPKYAEIIIALRESNVKIDENLSERELARFITRLMQFMEANLGRDADSEIRRMLTKFPIHVFSDLEPKGALFHILHTCYEFADEKKWDGIDFKDDALRAVNMEMLLKVSKVLKRRGLLPSVKAFFAPSIIAEQSDELQRILQTHGAVVVSSPEVASHIIYADTMGTKEDETDAQVLVRYLESDDERARVHWWYHPDSYDDWIPVEQVIGMIDDSEHVKDGPWHVTARWIRDLSLFNEWMNEIDYELNFDVPRLLSSPTKEANGVVSVAKSEEGSRTRSQPDSPVSEPIAKRLKLRSQSTERDDESEDRVRMSRQDEEVLSEGNADDEIMANGDSKLSEDEEDEEAAVAAKPTYTVPSFSNWFDLSKINDIEQNACPEFFSGKYESKTSEIYKEIRNYFVKSWRAKPKRYITVTSSRGKLIGDWPAILRVHSFLEHWGLINHNAAADTLPLPILSSPPAAVPAFNSTRGSNKVPFVFDDGSVACINNSRVVGTTLSGSPKKRPRNTRHLLFDKPDDSASDSDEDSDGSPRKNTVDYHCDICTQDCSTLRFHCATQSDMDLCETCYTEKKYDTSKMQPRDFIQMKSAGGGIGSQEVDEKIWTESETLLLLEALEMYEDNWELVAEHVGSKTKDQCVMQFVRLPIEDRFLDNPPGNCSDPAKVTDMAPVEMLKKAGAKKEALARVSSKTALPVPYSGRSSIYGADARNNAVASQALNLSTLTTTKLIAKPHAIMLGGVREDGFQGNFNDLTPAFPEAPEEDGDIVMTDKGLPKDSGKKAIEKSVELSMTTQEPYISKKESVPSAAEMAKTELGQLASEVLIELLGQDPELLTSLGNEGDNDLPSKRLAASVALAASAGRAAQMERLERAELDRLVTMLVEIKLDLLRIKQAHFESLEIHENRLKKLVADEGHSRFAREMRAHHRLTIRDPAAIPALNGPIGCDVAKDGPSKAARENPGVLDPSKKTSLIKPTSIRTVSKPKSMPHISPSEYFAMQLKEAEEARKKAEEARQEEKRKEIARQEQARQDQARQEQARQLAERLARATAEANANAARARAQQAQRQAQLAQQARQRAQHAGSAPYVNGIASSHAPNGAGPAHFTPQANGLQHSHMATPQNVAMEASHFSPHSRERASAPTPQQQPAPIPPQPVEASANANNVSKAEESMGPKTPVLPTKAARTKSRRRSRKSVDKTKTKPRKRTESSGADEEDRIVPARPKSKKRSDSIPGEDATEEDKTQVSALRRTRPSRERRTKSAANKPPDTKLKLRVRQKEDTGGGRVKKGRTTRTSLRSARNAVSIKLRLPIRPPKPLPLRLRLRPPVQVEPNEHAKVPSDEGLNKTVKENSRVFESDKIDRNSAKKKSDNFGLGDESPIEVDGGKTTTTRNSIKDKIDTSGDGADVDEMDVSEDRAEGNPSTKMNFRLQQGNNITQVNEVNLGGNETEDENDD